MLVHFSVSDVYTTGSGSTVTLTRLKRLLKMNKSTNELCLYIKGLSEKVKLWLSYKSCSSHSDSHLKKQQQQQLRIEIKEIITQLQG